MSEATPRELVAISWLHRMIKRQAHPRRIRRGHIEASCGIGAGHHLQSHPRRIRRGRIEAMCRPATRQYATESIRAGVITAIVFTSTNPSTSTSSTNDTTTPSAILPSIRVVGDDEHTLTFKEWHLDAFQLIGIMLWNGDVRIDTLSYTVKRYDDGAVVDRGEVDIPGNTFRAHEPTEIKLDLPGSLDQMDLSHLNITLKVQY